MGTVVELSTLRVMILEILSKNVSLKKDIFDALVNENPQFVETFSETKQTLSTQVDEIDPHFPVLEGLTEERKKWLNQAIDKDFAKYHDVFKALA